MTLTIQFLIYTLLLRKKSVTPPKDDLKQAFEWRKTSYGNQSVYKKLYEEQEFLNKQNIT